jgi:hypothetical protein
MYAISPRMFQILSEGLPTTTLQGKTELSRFKYDQKLALLQLNDFEKQLLTSYTLFGDGVINSALRQNVNTSSPTNNFVNRKITQTLNKYPNIIKELRKTNLPIIPLFISKFIEVFKKIPPLKEELVVYRGLTDERYISTHGNEFLSASYDKAVANSFRKNPLGCCLLTITLKPGIKAFWIEQLSFFGPLGDMAKSEKEILIAPPYTITKEKVDDTNYNVIISPYVKGARRTKKNHNKRKHNRRKTISYRSFFD